MRNLRWFLLIALLGKGALCFAVSPSKLTLTSPAFHDHGTILTQYTCDGAGRSPALQWSNLPSDTQSVALIVSDPDAPDPAAPKVTWIHWVLYNLPVTASGLSEGVTPKELPTGTQQGANSWQRTGYGAPCPPIGTHRYVFTLYALNTKLPDLKMPSAGTLQHAMSGHILEQTVLIGTYHH